MLLCIVRTCNHVVADSVAWRCIALALSIMLGAGVALASPSTATTRSNASLKPLIISNDHGGVLTKRLRQITELRASGREVRIEGQVFLSTCTMFISLPQTCIDKKTTFGFHGPSSFGRRLDPELFEWASQVISMHYPPILQDWYMEKGRYRINRLYRIKGEKIAELAVPVCDE